MKKLSPLKFESLLSRLATLGLATAVAGLALDASAVPLFAAATALLVMLVATGDYARTSTYAKALAVASHRREAMPLAA